MRPLLAAFLLFALAALCRAEEAKPNTLTPQEIAEGWLLLFDGETTFGWDNSSKPEVQGGILIQNGSNHDVRISTTTGFRLYQLKLEYRIEKTKKDAPPVTWHPTNHTALALPLPIYKDWASASLDVKDGEIFVDTLPIIETKQAIAVTGKGFVVTSKPKLSTIPQRIIIAVPKGNKFSLRNVKVKPFDAKPLFNGKDLSGWKQLESEYKRVKSQFSVTKEGWLNIQNGPGDLQTTREWADFVLQLDCRTNGDHLNSGVFFRCIPGQYQRGYEAQIQNQKAKELKKYTIEEYDPKTHKLVNKKEIENWSQDYGTGAIYRRIPARRAVAKDRE